MDRKLTILVVEPDEDYVELLRLALRRLGIDNPLQVVRGEIQAIEYLAGQGIYENRDQYPFPSVLFTEISPRTRGLEVIRWLRNHPECAVIPVLVLAASDLETDVSEAYRLGVNTYFDKPARLDDLQNLLRLVHDYWSVAKKPRVPTRCSPTISAKSGRT